MNKQLIIVLTGRKQAGKSSACNFILSEFVNRTKKFPVRFGINGKGLLTVGDLSAEIGELSTNELSAKVNAKIYSFADPLKSFCVDVLGAPVTSCYGTDIEKNIPIPHLLWENMPKETRPKKEVYVEEYRTGPITGRELMQAWGTEICRKLYGDCWARGTFSAIKKDSPSLALIADGRFPNEVDMGLSCGAKSIRLLRRVFKDEHKSETALDEYPLNKFNVVIENTNITLKEQCSVLLPHINQWFDEAGL